MIVSALLVVRCIDMLTTVEIFDLLERAGERLGVRASREFLIDDCGSAFNRKSAIEDTDG